MVHVCSYLGGQGREITSSGQARGPLLLLLLTLFLLFYLAYVCLCVFVCVAHVWMLEATATGNSEANVDAGN